MRLRGLAWNRRSVLFKWLVSYISVLFVPIVISGIIYTGTWHVVESEVNRANESVLKQIEQGMDSHLSGIERLGVEMALSKPLSAFIDVAQPLSDSDIYDIVGISNDLKTYKMANTYIEQIYVYYKNSDTVVSARDRGTSRDLFAVIGTEDNWGAQEWEAFFNKRYVQEYLPITITENGRVSKGVMYAKSMILANQDQPGAVLMFVVKESTLLAGAFGDSRSTVAIMDKSNRLVASTGADLPAGVSVERMQGKSGFFYEGKGDGRLAVSYTTSENAGWKYLSLVPAEIFDEKMQLVKNLIYLSLGLSILVGGLVTFLSVRRNYSPVGALVRNLMSQSGVTFETGIDEYRYVQSAFNNTLDEKERMGQRLERHRSAIRAHFLQGLLKGTAELQDSAQEALEAHGIHPVSPEFAVVIFSVEHYGKFADDGHNHTKPQKQKLVHFIIMNVAEEVAGIRHQGFAVEADNTQACIINFRNGEERDLPGMIQEIRSFMEEHYHVTMTVAASGIHEHPEGIGKAYLEARAALEYRLVLGGGRVIRYEELPRLEQTEQATRYYFPLHVEQQLINFVKSGDYARSKSLLDEIIEANLSGALPVPLAKCLMFDLIGTLLKTLDETGSAGKTAFMEQADPVKQLISCETMEEMRRQTDEVLQQVCQSIQEEHSRQSSHLSREIMEYVKAHYQDGELNVSAIGDIFKLTPSYLSKQFKAQTGEALPDYINKTRMEEAKRLLREQGCSVAETASKVGYADLNTFTRIFKKYEGITPGKYKDIQISGE
ncbi:helix-turn-helix domain-containing protein [Paenibacillus sp. YN15]|uniref:helix-turn-helix domain-containing protein n=1 Tax=Paenibacillus sp. YN15 TaxID=1742774 RepID=UPI000DCDF62D|nr:helix-turn-helix domain-containing protein [Paenibacillus sp. YN15]RAU93291.1 AraC family transcriptional regulator [Paenibacillus sp. YN15]